MWVSGNIQYGNGKMIATWWFPKTEWWPDCWWNLEVQLEADCYPQQNHAGIEPVKNQSVFYKYTNPAMDNPGDDILRLSYDTWEVSSEVSWRGKHLWNLKPKKGYHQPVATVPFAVRLNMLWYFTIFLISDSEPVGAGTPGSSMIAEALEREHWANHQMASRQRSRENLPYVLVHGQPQPAWTAGEMNSRIPSHPPRSSN